SLCALSLGDQSAAEAERAQAADPHTPVTALDHFLDGESLRRQFAAVDELTGAEPGRSRPDQAIQADSRALEVDPGHFWSRFQRGRSNLSLGRRSRSDAVADLGACIVLRPHSPWGYSARGLALGLLKRYDAALQDLNRAIGLGSRPAQLNRGM